MKIYHVTTTYVPGESWFVKANSQKEAIEEVLHFEGEIHSDYAASLYVAARCIVYDLDENTIVGHVEHG